MKRLRLLLLLMLPLAFVACTDTREELELKGDGSGTLAIKTDISKMLEMVKQFSGEGGDLEKNGLDHAFDTVMLMKDYIDTVKNISADQKALLKDGKAHVVMNVKEGIGKIDFSFPFASGDKLQQLYASLGNSSGGFNKLFEGMGKNMPGGDQSGGQNNQKGMPMIASVYNTVVKNGLYSRKVDKARYDELGQTLKLDELKQMGPMLGPMDYTLQIKLPRPVKRVTNDKAVLSDDKKMVTLKTDLMETFQHPELLSIDIEY